MMTVAAAGVGRGSGPPTHKAFGHTPTERGVKQDLDGEESFDFREDGLLCAVIFPVP